MVASNGVNKMGSTWYSFKWQQSGTLQVMEITHTSISKDALEMFMPSSHIFSHAMFVDLIKANHPCLMWRALQEYLCGLPTRCHTRRLALNVHLWVASCSEKAYIVYTIHKIGHQKKNRKKKDIHSIYTLYFKTK